MKARYLMDKSALARMTFKPVQQRLSPIIEAGEAASCSIIDLEVLYSARNRKEHEEIRRRRALAYTSIPLNEGIFQRAIEIQAQLSKTGRHRLPIPGLIIAAAAETAGVTLLHYDSDFDIIAEVTGQPVEWVVPQGTI